MVHSPTVVLYTSTPNLPTNQMMSERPDWFLLETAIDGFTTLIDEALDDMMENPVVVIPPFTGPAVNVLHGGDLLNYVECKNSIDRCLARRTAIIDEMNVHHRLLARLSQRQTMGGRLQSLHGLEYNLSILELEIEALREEEDRYVRHSPPLRFWIMKKFWCEFNLKRLFDIMIPESDSDLDVVTQNEMYAESVDLYQKIREEFYLMIRRRRRVAVVHVEDSDDDDETDEEDEEVDGDNQGPNDLID